MDLDLLEVHKMTQKQRDEARKLSSDIMDIRNGRLFYKDGVMQSDTNLIAQALQTARTEALEEVCKLCCQYCSSSVYELRQNSEGAWGHYGKITRDIVPCDAHEVRELMVEPSIKKLREEV